MKESPAGIIQKYVLSWIKYYENPIFLRNGIKFIPKGYHNCQLSIRQIPICPAEPTPWAVPFERGRCLRNFQENRNAIKRLAIFVAKGYNTPVNKNRGACDSRLRGSHQLRPFRKSSWIFRRPDADNAAVGSHSV